MKKSLVVLAFGFLVPSLVSASLTIVQDGAPKATIVVVKDALTATPDPKPDAIWGEQPITNKIAAAARDVQMYIEKISGAKLPIVSDEKDPGGILILVGRSQLTKQLDSKIPSGLTPPRREEGLLVLTHGNHLLLAGNDEGPYHGTEYAVSEFLERLGVRWYMPGEFGEIVPKMATIKIGDLNVKQSPDFPMRNWWGGRRPDMVVPEYRWKIRNRMNPVLHFLTIPQDGSTRGYLPADKLKADPTLAGKKRDGVTMDEGVPSLSNPKAVELLAEQIKERFRKNPKETSAAFAGDDGLPRDWSPESVKLNQNFPDVVGRVGEASELSVSEEWFDFVNKVTREVKKEFPNHLIGSNGYANRNTPPQGVELDPNIYIMFAAIWCDTIHAYDDPRSWQALRQGQMLKRWGELCKNVYMYNYLYIMLASAGTPVPLTPKMKRDFPLLKKWGIIGFSDEGRYTAMESGAHCMYLRARLEWDADLDVNKALDEFYANWYGAAAKPARAFWTAIESCLEKSPMLGHEDRIMPYVYTKELIAELEKDIAEAKAALNTRDKHLPEPEARVEKERALKHVRADELILNHLKGYMAMTEAEWAGKFAESVKQADYMMAQRKELNAMSQWYVSDADITTDAVFYYWGTAARKKYYQKLDDMTSGRTGELVKLLPDKTAFRLDLRDEGRFAEWYGPKQNEKNWTSILTTTPFFLQVKGGLDEASFPWMGIMWYRFDVDVPSSAKGKRVMLYAPTVETEAWVWVNGKYVGHRPYHEAYERPNAIDMDVTDALQPGKRNVIAVRVNTGLGAAGQAGGFYSRLFLYTPKKETISEIK